MKHRGLFRNPNDRSMAASPDRRLGPPTTRRSASRFCAPSLADSPTRRILLVSDNAQLRLLLSQLLVAHRYDAVAVDSSAASPSCADLDAAIIDFAAARGAARWLRTLDRMAPLPVLAIAADPEAVDEALWKRAEAVLHEPVDARQLLLVMRGLFAKQRQTARIDEVITAGPLTLHSLLNTVSIETRSVALTDAEKSVLRELMLAAGTTVSRERLTRSSLVREWSPGDRCLDTHIKRLRRKIGNDRHGRTPIRTVRGLGYRLVAEWQPAR